uniref:Methenyltetrahydrofolate cyclohydrolase n=1 Tax=Aplanochytrium stocchinoi TaxID=215587 RepID=A0A7S3V0N4_9STRA|mmetsp:Transcript_9362/g.11663  ORF Transcript_9362/g.11663 Transcript_9362/m.11663 type:complete len:357 (+) Transcript_9362:132-1202(+)|eukprot:CAMPEP_0204839048 /NCGR_PEP_ID=MMETSP1346-20131115/32898_1 /ASSEMBLY_ACC=CAM_ASM_000771 /TAXON_ID=215587 /ORGANISM="Aplanochytrium stocchinoi, Strain GSBS06" /LENGTH=356 /DNA_ID=CAMNT_0051975505 /DNA_START=132 /DNA_END=1202 /DNA_ORIENTATION=+
MTSSFVIGKEKFPTNISKLAGRQFSDVESYNKFLNSGDDVFAVSVPLKERFAEKIISGTKISALIREEVKKQVEFLVSTHNTRPGLAVVLVGERKDSATYVRMKKKAAAEVGFHSVDISLDDTVTEEELLKVVEDLNERDDVHGILVQLPLPAHVDTALVLKSIRVDKDVDGFSAENIGNLCLRGGEPPLALPCTPAGCVELLERSDVDATGKRAVVIGRSNIVGMPLAHLLISMDATVTVCHSKTENMKEIVKQADIVVAAVGRPNYVRGDWLKEGAVVLDVGINSVDDPTKKRGYRLVGDVCFEEAITVVDKITPVPGGVGPMTIAMLLKNTINLTRHKLGLKRLPLRKRTYSF